jgi:hypothetical protein
MDAFLFGVLGLFAVVLLIFTFIRKHVVLGVFSGLVFILLGLFAWNGLEYVSSTSVTYTSDSNALIVDNYTAWNHAFIGNNFTYTNAIGSLFIMFGLFMLIVSAVMLFDNKQDKQSLFSDDTGGGDDD